jgi:hypothetical protein
MALVLAVSATSPPGAAARTEVAEAHNGRVSVTPRLAGLGDGLPVLETGSGLAAVGTDGLRRPLGFAQPAAARWFSSTRLIALVRGREADDETASDTQTVTAAPLQSLRISGAPVTLFSCEALDREDVPPQAPVAADGDVVAIAQTAECRGEAAIRVFDLAAGSTPRILNATGRVTALAVRGPVVAYATARGVGVLDRVTGVPLYGADLPTGLVPGSIAVAADGTLAVVAAADARAGACSSRSVWVFSPAAPAGRRLTVGVCDFGVALAGADVLAMRPAGAARAALVRLAPSGAATTLAWSVVGPAERSGAATSYIHPVTPRFFTDGANVAYEQTGCSPPLRAFVAPLAEVAPAVPDVPSRCRVRASRLRVTGAGSRRTVSLRLICPSGCEGTSSWNATRPRDLDDDDGLGHPVALDAGEAKTMRWTIACRPRRSRRVTFKAEIYNAPPVVARRTVRC